MRSYTPGGFKQNKGCPSKVFSRDAPFVPLSGAATAMPVCRAVGRSVLALHSRGQDRASAEGGVLRMGLTWGGITSPFVLLIGAF